MSGFFLGGLADGLSGSSSSTPKYSFINEAPVETLRALYNQGYLLDDIADHTGLLKFEVSRKLGLDKILNNPVPGLGFDTQSASSSPVTSILSEQNAASRAATSLDTPSAPKSAAPGWLSIHQDLDQAIESTALAPSPQRGVDWTGRELDELEAKYDQATAHYTRAAKRYYAGLA